MEERDFRRFVEDLKRASDPAALAAEFGLQRKGRRFYCPECQAGGGKTPDFSVTERGFVCFKCGIKGDVIRLVEVAGKMTPAEAMEYLAKRTGLSWPKKREGLGQGREKKAPCRPAAAVKKPDEGTKAPAADHSTLYADFLASVCKPIEGTAGADYLAKRGISAATASRLGVRYCDDLAPLWKMADRDVIKAAGLSSLYAFQKAALPFVVFPYLKDGKPVFMKSRNLLTKTEADGRGTPRFLNTGAKVPCLWNGDAVKGADRVLICEGEIDALTAIEAGYCGVGLPGWSHWKDAWTGDFEGKEAILVMDADEAGEKGARDVAGRFVRAGLPCPRQLRLEDGKDLNDVFMESMKA